MAQKNNLQSCLFFFIILFVCVISGVAQNAIPSVEGWRVHLPFANNITLCESGTKVFVGSASGVFTFDENDRSVEVLSRVNGLSDVDVKIVSTCPQNGAVIVVYDNTNIDIIEGSSIFNINDIFSQVIIGEKRINNVSFSNNLAYLSCSFGIVVIDMVKKRIIDSYTNIGTSGSNLEIIDVQEFDGYLYGSTKTGIYRASLSSFNLSDYHSWSLYKTSTYSTLLALYRNKLYAIVDSTLQIFDGFAWTPYSSVVKNPLTIELNHEKIVSVTSKDIFIEDAAGTIQTINLNGLQGAIIGNGGILYTLGFYTGLMQNHTDGSIDYIAPGGPYGKTASRIAYNFADNSVWVAGGNIKGFGTSSGWDQSYNNNKFYRLTDNSWYSYNQSGDAHIENARDFNDVMVNPQNNHTFISSFGSGLFEIEATSPSLKFTVYDNNNSSLQTFNGGTMVSGSCIDNKGNLWVSNFGAVNPISVKTTTGQWRSFKLPSDIDGKQPDNLLGFITCDDNNYKWVFSTRNGGIIVYNDNNVPTNPNNHQIRYLQKDPKKGGMPSNTVFCVTKDQKGEMWVGTDQGLCIFSNTSNIFKQGGDYDARQIIIKTGLVNSIFLGVEAIYCIRVDAANRKWIGTKNGAWLVSADGYTVIKNFTIDNSPLLSNVVFDIGINEATGEVFFATDKGLISYMGTASEGGEQHGNVMVYPNPVRPEYQGLIAIRGLVNDANVKITDIAGNLVYETKANGGFATWNGLNFKGVRAATGVYLIYSSNQDATQQWVGKILFIN